MTLQRKARGRKILEALLLAIGAACLGIWGWSVMSEGVYEDWHNWAFERQVRNEPVDVTDYLKGKLSGADRKKEASQPAVPRTASGDRPEPGADGIVGRLSIPRLHVRAIVREGTGERTLSLALGHIVGTALPGQNGNVAIAGHRDALFRGLRNVRENDLVVFETASGDTFEYLVKSTQIVKPTQVSVLNAGLYPELTMVTCYPFNFVGSAPDRFIVKARQVSQITRGLTAAAIPPEPPKEIASDTPETKKPLAPSKLVPAPASRPPDESRIPFEVAQNHSRELGRGISVGLTKTDEARQRADGWMWLMPERRTVWLRDAGTYQPVAFSSADGRTRQLVITSISRNSIRGYILLEAGRDGRLATDFRPRRPLAYTRRPE
ncbi:MAG: class D sortase [Acidobacteriota bacterium]